MLSEHPELLFAFQTSEFGIGRLPRGSSMSVLGPGANRNTQMSLADVQTFVTEEGTKKAESKPGDE